MANIVLGSKMVGMGKPIVLLHPFPLSSEFWFNFRPPPGFQLILPNYPGFGNTPLDQPDLWLDAASRNLFIHLEQMGIKEPIVLGGISMGGYWSLEFLRQFPERVHKLILISTRAGLDLPDARQKRLETAQKVEKEGTAFLAEAMIPGLLGITTRNEKPEVVQRLTHWIQQAPSRAVANAQRAMANRRNQKELLPKVKVKSLVIAGLEDSIIPATEAVAMAQSIPDVDLHLVPKVGHLIPLEDPEIFKKILFDFLV